MPTLVIVGAQWGDEAKGKIVDVLSGDASFVVRFSGGNNAGHTVVVGDQEFRFSLLPAGILHPESVSILGGGTVIDPKSLLDELKTTRALQPHLGELKISSAAHVVFPYHRLLDQLQEEARGVNKIGTTSRGIGPAYEDKVSRIGIRMSEFVCKKRFRSRLEEVLTVKNRMLRLFGQPEIEFDTLFDEYEDYAEQLAGFVIDTDVILGDAVEAGQKVLFEGAQGTFLDLDAGTYPFVTSSHPIAGGACLGTGVGPRDIDHVLGVCKAYTTRVGSGPFPTEIDGPIGEQIREQGHEYGTITGRGRRCGWLDLVALKQSCRINSLSGLVVTRLDVLSDIERLSVCTAYRIDGQQISHLPADIDDVARLEPVYEEFEGWGDGLRSCRALVDLPLTTRKYLQFVESFTKTPAAILSVGPEREETIILRPDLIWG